MTTQVSLFDDKTQAVARISYLGEVITAPVAYSEPYHVSVTVPDDAHEIVPGISAHRFVITSMLIATSKSFGSATTAETVTLYEASSADIDTIIKITAELDFLKNDRLVATGLNLAIGEATSIVAIATDVNVSVTIAGYYIPVENSSR